ncbi:thiamine pyrophosphokinase [Lactifluus volemus]|nr:thiamine pyrophosphokinase [Lactifluus volemus]
MDSTTHYWDLPFYQSTPSPLDKKSQVPKKAKTALIILNQPFSKPLLRRLWHTSDWRCCADGGANLPSPRTEIEDYIPDIIKGDLDSLRDDVRRYYETRGVPVVQDNDENSTDLMKCIESCKKKRMLRGQIGLSGRLDQTVHTLSYLHKLRKSGRRIFAVTDDNVGWVLDEADSTVLTTTGLRWNLTKRTSGFDGLVSTSNHLVPEEDTVFVETSRPIWWVAELRRENI